MITLRSLYCFSMDALQCREGDQTTKAMHKDIEFSVYIFKQRPNSTQPLKVMCKESTGDHILQIHLFFYLPRRLHHTSVNICQTRCAIRTSLKGAGMC